MPNKREVLAYAAGSQSPKDGRRRSSGSAHRPTSTTRALAAYRRDPGLPRVARAPSRLRAHRAACASPTRVQQRTRHLSFYAGPTATTSRSSPPCSISGAVVGRRGLPGWRFCDRGGARGLAPAVVAHGGSSGGSASSRCSSPGTVTDRTARHGDRGQRLRCGGRRHPRRWWARSRPKDPNVAVARTERVGGRGRRHPGTLPRSSPSREESDAVDHCRIPARHGMILPPWPHGSNATARSSRSTPTATRGSPSPRSRTGGAARVRPCTARHRAGDRVGARSSGTSRST